MVSTECVRIYQDTNCQGDGTNIKPGIYDTLFNFEKIFSEKIMSMLYIPKKVNVGDTLVSFGLCKGPKMFDLKRKSTSTINIRKNVPAF